MPRVLMVASEAAPFAKTGGLSDVLGALPKALREIGYETAVLLPRYAETKPFAARRIWDDLPVRLGSRTFTVSILQAEQDGAYLFLDCPELYDRDGLYGDSRGDFPDNATRFGLLARGALEVTRKVFGADILHCHDWQAGLVPVFLSELEAGDPTFTGIRTLLTVHNLGYQGLFPSSALMNLGLSPSFFSTGALEFYGQISFLKGGLVFSNALSTVSPRYAKEIQTPEYGFGLDGILRSRTGVLSGILNGVDYSRWNPETDALIPANYSASDLAGKQVCKRALLRQFGLPETALAKPLLGIVSRLTGQKGVDLIAAISPLLFEEDVYMVALGNGEPEYEELFRALNRAHPGRASVYIGFSDELAHRVEAGADIFLMPSRYEPCGLNQIYSLRYGTVPVVRATGGLDDTVDESTGFKFLPFSGDALLGAVREAIAAYQDKPGWTGMMQRGMARDYSWKASAHAYARLYEALLNPRGE